MELISDLDKEALAHYTALTEQFYPAGLALALVTARYQHQLAQQATLRALPPTIELPALRETLSAVAESRPELKRDIGRTVAAIDRSAEGRKRV